MLFFGNHGWENRFGDAHPIDTIRRVLKERLQRFFWRLRIDLCFDENDGFDVGAFVGTWKRARGPFLLHRQQVSQYDFENGRNRGPWRLMVALSPAAWDGFTDGAIS